MAFLSINGIEVPVAFVERLDRPIGANIATLDGTNALPHRSRLRQYRVTTAPLTTDVAAFWQGMVSGAGHYWSTTSLASSKTSSKGLAESTNVINWGSGISGGGVATYNPALGSAYFSATAPMARFPTNADPARWSYLDWRFAKNGSAAWRTEIVKPGSMFVNGVLSAEPPNVRVSDGTDGYALGTLCVLSSMVSRAPIAWQPSTQYTVGQVAFNPYPAGGYASLYICTQSGTSGTALPWQGTGSLYYGGAVPIVDNEVLWLIGDYAYRIYIDAVFLPYLIPDSMVAEIDAARRPGRWSALPSIFVSGDLLGGAKVTMRGFIESSNASQVTGVAISYMRALTFILQEMPG